MDETHQINLCIDEMAKLKEKMEALEKQKILNEKNEMLKKTTMEPNLKVLEDWLVEYKNVLHIKQQNELEEKLRNVRDEQTLKNNIIFEINWLKEDVYKKIYHELKTQNIHILPNKIRNNKDYKNMIKKIEYENCHKEKSKAHDYGIRIRYLYNMYDRIIEFVENYNKKLTEEEIKNIWKVNHIDLQKYTSIIDEYKQEKLNNENILQFIENETLNMEYDTYSNVSKFKNKLVNILNSSHKNISSYSYNIIEGKRYSTTGKYTEHYYNEPSKVMETHIEATYNMFNIINKRLDVIEKKLIINN